LPLNGSALSEEETPLGTEVWIPSPQPCPNHNPQPNPHPQP
jgi:hypothetical protein